MIEPVVVVHGGAGRIAPDNEPAACAGTRAAAAAAMAALAQGAPAWRAAIAAVRVLEDDPTFNAGRGSCMNADGIVEVDAAIMRGSDRGVGAIAAVPELGNAIDVAAAVLEVGGACLLAGAGAVAFARARGIGRFGREQVWTAKAQARWDALRAGDAGIGQADTVGAVVRDADGHVAAAGSTGGVLGKPAGRVGDTPMVGAGLYADDAIGAAVATGLGEAILRRVASYELLRRIAAGGDPDRSAREVCDETAALAPGATCGLVAIDATGRIAIAHASRHMSHAWIRGDGSSGGGVGR